MQIGWKRSSLPTAPSVGILKFKTGVLSGEAGLPASPPDGLTLGYMMLIREGEGEGAREEKVLETLEAGLISQFCSSARSSGFEGPPSEISANTHTHNKHGGQYLTANNEDS